MDCIKPSLRSFDWALFFKISISRFLQCSTRIEIESVLTLPRIRSEYVLVCPLSIHVHQDTNMFYRPENGLHIIHEIDGVKKYITHAYRSCVNL